MMRSRGHDVFVRKAAFNGKPLKNAWIPASEMIEGGTLSFEMGPGPSDWGKDAAYPPIPFEPGNDSSAGPSAK
jgi:putative alpha-1,2-mannosidase